MKKLILALVLTSTTFAVAGELDDESQVINKNLNSTVVVRVDSRDKSVAVLNTQEVVASEAQAVALTQKNFDLVPSDKVRSELDQDGGSSSWYVYWYNYSYAYYPTYCWGRNYYSPYYNYRYSYYTYYYYGAYNRWW